MNSVPHKLFDQHGMSIVEIMIGLLLSSALTAGAIQIYLSNKQTYYLQDEMSRLQENGRFAIEILQRSIRGAGIIGGQVFVDANTVDASDPPSPYNPANAVVQTSSNDQIEVVRNGWTDCTGTPRSDSKTEPPVAITEFFYIDTSKNLSCFSNGVVAQLVGNVETMAILYGVDEDGDLTADGYRIATQVAATDAWSRIVSVRIGLLLGSSADEARNRIVPQPMTFPTITDHPLLSAFETNNGKPALFDGDGDGLPDTNHAPNINGAGLPDPDGKPDRRLYRVFTTTIALRNRIF